MAITLKDEWSGLMARINSMSNQFTKTDWKIMQYIRENTEQILSYSAQELARGIGTSDASIIRFAQKVGYSGLSEFKYELQKQLSLPKNTLEKHDSATLLQDNKFILKMLYSMVDPEKIDRLRKKMRAADRVFIVGLEINRSIAELLAYKFSKLGLSICTLTNDNTLSVYRRLSTAKDLFITLSLSGEDKALSATLADLMNNGSYITLFSNYEKTLCAAYADLLLLIPRTQIPGHRSIISDEIPLLQLGDMIVQNFLSEDEAARLAYQESEKAPGL